MLNEMLVSEVPKLAGAIALVDSPRWPSDLDWSKASTGVCSRSGKPGRRTAEPSPEQNRKEMTPRGSYQTGIGGATNSPHGRAIDAGLRALVSKLRGESTDCALKPLSLFPTPPMNYFGAHLNLPTCKPHLRLLGEALFGAALNRDYGLASGGIFTRFMIAGFATYQALKRTCAEVYECYPDLQFRLWCRGQQLFSKNASTRSVALASRIRILSALACELEVSGFHNIRRMDEADAAILALSTFAARRRGATLIFENNQEGSFLVAMDEPDANYLHLSYLDLA
jgi:hypothetical protein